MERKDAEPIRLLLVDDEKQFVLNLERILGRRGFHITTAFNGKDAVALVKSGEVFDVVVLDIRMPGIDGIAALKEIKALAPLTQVIMLTGYASIDSGIQAVRCGAYDYLMKPCAIENLVEKIKEANKVKHIRNHPVLWESNDVKRVIIPLSALLNGGDATEDASALSASNPLAVGVDSSLTEIAHHMMIHGISSAPVVEAEKVIGLIRLVDILRHIDRETA